MYREFWHFLRGEIRLKIETPTPERIINLCAAHHITFWDVGYAGKTTLFLRTDRAGAFRLRAAARNIQAEFTTLGETGAPRLARTFRRRYVLWAAAAVFALLAWCGHTFIWDFSVEGSKTVPEEEILRALEDYGITLGSRTKGIDQKDMRNHVLLELPDVCWLAVNVKGCTAHVQVVERTRPPQRQKDAEKTNVVAAKSGLVTKIQALDGEKCVLPGTTVTEGQLLISGAVDAPDATGARLLHAQGNVWARTWYDLSVKVPLTMQKRGNNGRTYRSYYLNLGKRRIKIAGRGSMLTPGCGKIQAVRECRLPGGLHLPVTFCREETTVYPVETVARSREEALAEGKAALLRLLKEQLGTDAAVENTCFSQETLGNYLLVTLSAECTEQIGAEIPIA